MSSRLHLLDDVGLQLVFFGGKGGTGKTTCAAACALHLARERPRRRILLVSTDPAHSLGDSLDLQLGNVERLVPGTENLWAREIDAGVLDADFRKRHGGVIETLADRGTYFDRADIHEFMELSLPGIDEVMAVLEFARILKQGRFDLLIVDTAPTGHTLRMLALPGLMEQWVRLLELMQEKHRAVVRGLTGRYRRDEADDFLRAISADLRGLGALLADHDRTEFVAVTIPEPASIEETSRLLAELRRQRIRVRNLVINRVSGEAACRTCASRANLPLSFAEIDQVEVPCQPTEVRGVDRLLEIAGHLSGAPGPTTVSRAASPPLPVRAGGLRAPAGGFILFGGKGGVGKTTAAAAAALALASRRPEARILIFSSDPAHSLSDAFGRPIGDAPVNLGGRLEAMEVDAGKLLESFKRKYLQGIEQAFGEFLSRGMDLKFDRRIAEQLIAISPPGVDELMALMRIAELESRYDLFILDTAPTGHLLRLLEMPDVMTGWLHAIFRLLLKYKSLVRLGEVARVVVELAKQVRKVRRLLTDRERTRFVAVTIPEAMAVAESRRLLEALRRLKVPCEDLIVNQVFTASACDFCSAKAADQVGYRRELRGWPGLNVHEVTQRPIEGIEDLANLGRTLFTGGSFPRSTDCSDSGTCC